MIKTFTLLFALISGLLMGQSSEIVFVTESTSQHQVLGELSKVFGENQVKILSRNTAISTTQRFIWTIEVPLANEEKTIQKILNYSFVLAAERNGEMKEVEIDRYDANDPSLMNQWAADNTDFNPGTTNSDINLPETWFVEKGSEEIILAIVDSGVNEDHPEFSERTFFNEAEVINGIDDDNNGYVDDISGWDFIDFDNTTNDQRGHGTAVAGVAAANGDNNVGIAGVDWNCKILDVRVLDGNGSGSFDAVSLGIYYAVNMGAHVINLSLGGTSRSDVVEDAISYALTKNVLVVAAMGNFGDETLFYPAAISGVFSVGATNYYDERCDPFIVTNSGGSNYGSHINVVAPGDYIIALSPTNFDNYSDYSGGTSLAAPFVSGLACLLLAQDPSRSVAELKWLIESTADDQVGPPIEDREGFDNYYGHGRINGYKAVTSTVSRTNGTIRVTTHFDSNTLSILLDTHAEEINVTTIDGRLVYSEQSPQPGVIELQLSPGVYIAYMINKGTLFTRKVLII